MLLVDDEECVRDLCRHMLERLGFKVLQAVDGYQALEIFRENHLQIRCVLLDLTMPRMDGEETFRELQAIDPGVCVVMTSGYSEIEVADRFAGKGLKGFIQKPYKLDDMTRVLKSIMDETSKGE